ncbi:MAG: polysaccharide biosynthesis tyrosine autokinase [Armatimonadetes bacterium]|nr:polysaccharide biosynthesis tyrosine autokinase [Armatimonadota bacterium]
MEFWRYYRIIRRRRWLIILGMVICVGAVQYNNMRSVQQYTGRTTLMESKGMSREGTPLYPEQFMQLDIQLRISNLSNIAVSQKVMGNAAETLSDLNLSFSPQEILGHTSVQPVKDSNILAVEVTLPNPDEAKIAADVIAAEFRKAYSELNNSEVRQSREFIEAQLLTTRLAMVKAQNALRQFQEQNEVVDLTQQNVAAVQRMTQAKSNLNQWEATYQAAHARVAKQESELKKLQPMEVAVLSTAINPEWQQLRAQLISFETQKAGMLGGKPGETRRGPNHPDVQNVQRQIDDLREQLREMAQKQYILSGKTEQKNPVYVNAVDRYISAKVDEVGADAQLQAVSSVIDDVRSEMAGLPAKQAKYTELATDVQAANQTYGLMRTKLDEAKIKEQQAKNEVSLKTIDPAYVFPVNQKGLLKLILALLLSPILGIGAAFLLHYTDNTVKSAPEAEKLLGLPVLSAVPGTRAHSLPRQHCSEVVDVAYQMLTSSLWVASQNQDVNSVVMISAEPDVGRSVTASNLAVALAKEGARVVLVDADLRQPTQHLIFGVENKVGLTNVLTGGASLEDALVPTKIQGLLLVPTGPVPDNPVKLLRSAEMKDLDNQVKAAADFVVYDTPAGVTFPDPVLVAAQVGSAIVVHSAGRVPRGSEAELRAKLESVGVRLLGVVLNKVRREDSSGYFHYRRSYQGIGTPRLPGAKGVIRS